LQTRPYQTITEHERQNSLGAIHELPPNKIGKNMSRTQDIITCPFCLYPNEGNVTVCARCGKEIIQTVNVADIQMPTTAQFAAAPPVEVAPDTFTLMVAGFKTPLSVHRQTEILIGRRVPDQSAPDVDLAPYNGYKLGISRRHAILRCTDDGCSIEDQGSSNLTWVNENQLSPFEPYLLHSGDTLRLGHLVMNVYFSTVEIIYLSDTSPDVPRHLTPTYLVKVLGPYLQALGALQGVMDMARGREASEVLVSSLRYDPSGVIQITLKKAGDAILLLQKYVAPWINAHPAPVTEADKAAYEEALKKLVEELLPSATALVDAPERAVYSQRLFVVLRSLVQCSLQPVNLLPAKRKTDS
jgi:hypothetical protein